MSTNQIKKLLYAMDLPLKGHWYLDDQRDSCTVTLVNMGNGKRDIRSFDFAIQDNAGAVYDLAWAMVEKVK